MHKTPNTLTSPEFDKSRVFFDIWFSAHSETAPNDFEGLEEKLRYGGYDIYIPETFRRTPLLEEYTRGVVKGDYKTYQGWLDRISAENALGLLIRAMYATRINVFHADYTEEQAQADQNFQWLEACERGLSTFDSLENLIEYCREHARVSSAFYQDRDTNIVRNIENGLPVFISQHPKLMDKDEIRVLLSVGDAHILLPELLEDAGYGVDIKREPPIITAVEEAENRLALGQELDRPLLLEAAATNILFPHLSHNYTDKIRYVVRSITSNLPEQAVVGLLDGYRQNGPFWVHNFVRMWMTKLDISDPDLKFRYLDVQGRPVIQ